MERRGWKKALWALVTVGVFGGPYAAYQGYQYVTRDTVGPLLDESVPGLSTDGTVVKYQNKTQMRADGLGVSVLTWAEYQKDRARLPDFAPAEADFPVVLFFNETGFDATGDVKVIRRAKDGKLLWVTKDVTARVSLAVSRADGSFQVFYADGSTARVPEKEWYEAYMGLRDPKPLPPPEELDRMTPEQLKALGVERLTKEEFEARHGKLPPADKAEPAKEKGPAPKEVKDGKSYTYPKK